MIKTFPIRMPIDFHKLLQETAGTEHLSINEFIIRAIQEKITNVKSR